MVKEAIEPGGFEHRVLLKQSEWALRPRINSLMAWIRIFSKIDYSAKFIVAQTVPISISW